MNQRKTTENEIKFILRFSRPENVHSVHQFFELTSYIRKFIQKFAQVASPLTRLLKKDSFQVKSKLNQKPILAIIIEILKQNCTQT